MAAVENGGESRDEAMMRQAEATQALADAGREVAAAINAAAVTLQPMAEAVHSLSEAQKRFCAFIVGHRLKIAGSAPVVMVAVGAISPNAAHVLAQALRAWGVG